MIRDIFMRVLGMVGNRYFTLDTGWSRNTKNSLVTKNAVVLLETAFFSCLKIPSGRRAEKLRTFRWLDSNSRCCLQSGPRTISYVRTLDAGSRSGSSGPLLLLHITTNADTARHGNWFLTSIHYFNWSRP